MQSTSNKEKRRSRTEQLAEQRQVDRAEAYQ